MRTWVFSRPEKPKTTTTIRLQLESEGPGMKSRRLFRLYVRVSTAEKAKNEKTLKFHFLPACLPPKPSLHTFPSSRAPCPHPIAPPVQLHLTSMASARFRQSLRRPRRAPMTVHPYKKFLLSLLSPRSHLHTQKRIASILPPPHRGKTRIMSR